MDDMDGLQNSESPEMIAKRLVVEHIKLTVDMEGHIAFDGPCRIDAIKAYRRKTGCSLPESRRAIETAITRWFGVGLVEFIARMAYSAGVLAAKEEDVEKKPPLVLKKTTTPDDQNSVTVEQTKHSSNGNPTDGNAWAGHTTDDACTMKYRHVSHTWPHSDGMTTLECDGQQNITRSGIARAAVMPSKPTDSSVSKLRRMTRTTLTKMALSAGMSRGALVGMTRDELATELAGYLAQNPDAAKNFNF